VPLSAECIPGEVAWKRSTLAFLLLVQFWKMGSSFPGFHHDNVVFSQGKQTEARGPSRRVVEWAGGWRVCEELQSEVNCG
jgi:hypothetical protein